MISLYRYALAMKSQSFTTSTGSWFANPRRRAIKTSITLRREIGKMFLSKTFVVGAQKYRIIETVLLSTHKLCFGREISELILVTRCFT